jgi:hypothetical protein
MATLVHMEAIAIDQLKGLFFPFFYGLRMRHKR